MGQDISTMVDSGASTSFIPSHTLKHLEDSLGTRFNRESVKSNLRATLADGRSRLNIVEKVWIPVHDNMLAAYVIESENNQFILGQDVISQLGINLDKLVLDGLISNNGSAIVQQSVESDATEDLDDSVFGAVMFDEEINIPDASQFQHLRLGKEERMLLNTVLEVKLPEALSKRDKGKPISIEPIDINLDVDGRPIQTSMRKYSPEQERYLEEWTKELLDKGFIEPASDSVWSSPVHVVSTEAGTYRMVIDLRRINQRVHLVRYPLPNLDTIQAKLRGSKFYAKLDACKGYFQVPISESSRDVFAFTTHSGKFKPTRLPQGFKNSVSIYQDVMRKILGQDLLSENVMVLLDDVLLYGSSLEELLGLLLRVVTRLSERNLLVNWQKTVWVSDELVWCGRHISARGVGFDRSHMQNFVDMAYPQNAFELQRFLCGVNFFRNSLLDFARIAQPLQEELHRVAALAGSRKNKNLAKFNIADDEAKRDAFVQIKTLLLNAITMSWPQDEDDVFVFSDASDLGFAVVASFSPPDQSNRALFERDFTPCGLLSGTFKGSQLRWTVGEKEFYPIVLAAQKLWHLLHRRKGFHILTDHKDLEGFLMKTTEVDERRPLLDKMARWRYILSPFEFTIKHISGTDNVFADMASRMTSQTRDNTDSPMLESNHNPSGPILQFIHLVNSVKDFRYEFPSLEEIVEAQRETTSDEKTSQALTPDGDNVLRLKGKIYVPNQNNLRKRFLIAAHSLQHNGVDTTKARIELLFSWAQLKLDVKKFIDCCVHCKTSKSNYMVNMKIGRLPKATKFGEIWHMDFFTFDAQSKRYFLVAKDDWSHLVEIFDTKTLGGSEVARALSHIMSTYGVPAMVMFDGGSHFVNKVVNELCQRYHMIQRFSMPYVHRSHGSVERANRSIVSIGKAILSETRIPTKEWYSLKDVIKSGINNTPISAIGKSPLQLLYGERENSLLHTIVGQSRIDELDIQTWNAKYKILIDDFRRNLDELHATIGTSIARDEADVQVHKLAVGDYVMYGSPTTKKIKSSWQGPYQVVEIKSPHIIVLREAGTEGSADDITAHVSRVRYMGHADLEIGQDILEQSVWLHDEYELSGVEEMTLKEGVYMVKVKWHSTDGKLYKYDTFRLNDFEKVFPKELLKFIALHQQDTIVKQLLDFWNVPNI